MDGAAGSVASQRLEHAVRNVDVGSLTGRPIAEQYVSPQGEAPLAASRTLTADPGTPSTTPPTPLTNPGMPPADPAEPHEGSAAGFGDRVASLVAARASQLVLGLDPDPSELWPRAVELADRAAGDRSSASRAARAVAAHCSLAIEATAAQCVAVKLQVACFERLGAPGWAALREVAQGARARGLLVIADAKRGDIDVTAKAYAQAFLGDTPTEYGAVDGLDADALTVNPLLGTDSLAPFVEAARERKRGGGLFVLVRTSNPGAADLQDLELASGGTVSDRLAAMVAELGAPEIGTAGLSDMGAVVGATAPERMEALRALMPAAVFLLPGVGAQGGQVEQLSAAFAPGPAGGLIAASRGIVDAYRKTGGDPAAAAASEASRLRELAWKLAA